MTRERTMTRAAYEAPQRAVSRYDLTDVDATLRLSKRHYSATSSPLGALAFLPLGEAPWWLLAGLTILILAAVFAGGFLVGVREGLETGALRRRVVQTELLTAIGAARSMLGPASRQGPGLHALDREMLKAWHAALDLSEPAPSKPQPTALGAADRRHAL